MVSFRFPSLSVPRCFQRSLPAFGAAIAAFALMAIMPQARAANPATFTVGNTTFPVTAVGSSKTQNVTLTVNTAVPISSISIAPNFTEYTLGKITGCTIDGVTSNPIGTVCTIPVTFKPKYPGNASNSAPISRSAPLLVMDIESGNATGYSFALTGSATGQVFAFAPGFLTSYVGNTTFAGGFGTPGCPAQTDANGDGCPATDARIYSSGMALDTAGNLYIVDGPLNVVHRVDVSTGIISIYAGQRGVQTPICNNCPADKATFYNPQAIAIDQAGNVYIDDPAYGLWKINAATNIVSLISGNSYSLSQAITDGKPLSQTSLGVQNFNVLVDSAGNIYLSSYENGTVYRVDAVTNLITYYAGNGTPAFPATGVSGSGLATNSQLGTLEGMAMDSLGNLYITDHGNALVYKVTPSGMISIFAGTQETSAQYNTGCYYDSGDWGPATSAFVGFPSTVAVDAANNVYIGEPGSEGGQSCPVRRVDVATGIIHTVAGEPPYGAYNVLSGVGATETYMSADLVAVDGGGNIYVGMVEINSGVVKVSPSESAIIFPEQSEFVTSDQLVTVSNVGIGEDLTLSNYPFPLVLVSSTSTLNPQPLPFSNAPLSGTDPEDCSSGTVAPGGICGIQIAFYPDQATQFNATATDTIEANSLGVVGSNVINISGSAYNGATATLTPNPISFTSQPVDTPTTATNVNFGIFLNPALTGISATITGTDASSFSLSTPSSNPCTPTTAIASGGGNCNIGVIFDPQSSGTLNAFLNATWVAGGIPYSLSAPISGIGGTLTPIVTLAPNPLNFSNQALNTTSPVAAVTLTNTGNTSVTLGTIAITGAGLSDFAISTGNNPCTSGSTVAIGDSCSVYVTFTPASAIAFTATLNLPNNATGSPQSVTLNGTGFSFVSPVGTAQSAEPVMVTFATAGTLNSVQLLTQGDPGLDFTDTTGGSCTTSVAYNVADTCTVNVVFKPLFSGPRNGAILLTDAANNVLGTAYLAGTGTGPQIVFGSQAAIELLPSNTYSPSQLTVDGNGNLYFTSSTSIYKLPKNGNSYGTAVSLGSIPAANYGVTVDGAGNVYIATLSSIIEIPWNGSSYGTQVNVPLGAATPNPKSITVDGFGNLYFADSTANTVDEVPWTGSGFGTLIVLPFTGLNGAFGAAVDGNGDVFCINYNSNNVVELPKTATGFGTQITVFNTGSIPPLQLTVDPSGDLYISEVTTFGAEIIELPYSGGVYSSPVTLPVLSNNDEPIYMALDGAGNVFIADSSDRRLYEYPNATPPSLTFPTTQVGSTSGAQTVAISNIGNASMTLTAPGSGTNPSYPADFPVSSGTANLCSSANALAPGSNCNVSVQFKPTTSGTLSEDVVLTDNDFNLVNGTQSIPVSGTATSQQTAQTINFTQPATPQQYASGLQIGLVATGGGSGNPVVFTLDASSTGNGSISGSTLTVTGVGTIVIDANQAGDSTYSAAAQVQRSVLINQAQQTINFTQPATPQTFVSGLQITLSATGGASGNPIVFTIDSTSTATGTISANVVTVTSTGYLVLDANQAGNTNYSAAAQVQRTVVVNNKAAQTINFTQPATPQQYASGLQIGLVATGGGSGNPVVFTLDASSTGNGSISGSTLTVTGVGTIVIDANQAGNSTYSAAAQVQRTVLINQAQQTINFTQPATPQTYSSGLQIALTATGGASGNPVLFTLDASSTGTGSISGSTLSVTTPGTFVIDANQAGNANYSAAAQVQRTVLINQAQQTINFTQPATPQTYSSGLQIALTATGGASGNPVLFTLDASSTATGSISGSTLTVTSAGKLVIDANQAGNTDYSLAPQVQRSVVISQIAQTINFTQPTSPQTLTSGLQIPLLATGGASGNPIVFTIDSSSTATGTISGSSVNVTGTGNLVLDANQAGNTDYSPASEVQRTVVIAPQFAADFSISATPAALTVTPGASAVFSVALQSVNGSFTNPVTLSVSGLPTGATANFSPASVTPGNAGGASSLTVATASPFTAKAQQPNRWPLVSLALLLFLPFKRWRRAWAGRLLTLLAALTLFGALGSMMGCGGGFSMNPPPQSYTLTITGTSGGNAHSTTVQLTVQ